MRILYITIVISGICSLIAAIAADFWIDKRIAIVGSFVGLRYSLNPGIAWGIRLPSGVQEILILLALVAVGSMAVKARNRLSLVAFGCVIGGGVANIIDRLRDGYVTDFFQIGSFPIFNVADSFITVGVGLLLVEAFLVKKGASS
jgi:signal peptidase II